MHCWMMIAQVPIAKFEQSKLQGFLTNRLLHLCLDIALAGLKECSQSAQDMLGPDGQLRRVRTFLVSYIADLPEQQALSCVTTNYAPSSKAGPGSLGDSAPHPLRKGIDTIKDIQAIDEELEESDDQDNLERLRRVSKAYGLNGVDRPFWRDWLNADPSLFLTPDALHQWHKLFADHPIEWAKHWLGMEELDRRLSVLQPRVGFRHFPDGFTRFRQHTGKETKDLERVFLGVIAGHASITKGIMEAMRGLLDFIYLAQYDSHSSETLLYLDEALQKFHRNKKYIADSGVRDGPRRNGKFDIPKIELMHHVKRMIQLVGSLLQFSSEQTERCHIDMAKIPYKNTNRKGYAEQMCRYLDRKERMRLFSALTEWYSANDGAMINVVSFEQQRRAFQRLAGRYLPTPVRDVFLGENVLCNDTTAFQLRQKPNRTNATIDFIKEAYEIPNFDSDLHCYLHGPRVHQNMEFPFKSITTWERVRVQLRDPQDVGLVLSPLTIEAIPRKVVGNSAPGSVGRYNFVLLHREASLADIDPVNHDEDFGIKGMCISYAGSLSHNPCLYCRLHCRAA